MQEFKKLVDIVSKLRDKKDGCPWDKAQTSKTLIKSFIEEFYETLEAVENDDPKELCEELGDLLLHIVMQAQIADEEGKFSIDDVLASINKKLISRHPHVFENAKANTPQDAKFSWEKMKRHEKKDVRTSVLDGIPRSMPQLLVARRIAEKAASVGFDWEKPEDVLPKIAEEFDEVRNAFEEGKKEQIETELGDLIFAVVNFARKVDVDPELSLKSAIKKFERRFFFIEGEHKRQNLDISTSTLEFKENLWKLAKKSTKD